MYFHPLREKIDECANLRCQVSVVCEDGVNRCVGRYQGEVLEQGDEMPVFEIITNYPGGKHYDPEPGQGSVTQENKAIRVEPT